jgi:hypothetical protein
LEADGIVAGGFAGGGDLWGGGLDGGVAFAFDVVEGDGLDDGSLLRWGGCGRGGNCWGGSGVEWRCGLGFLGSDRHGADDRWLLSEGGQADGEEAEERESEWAWHGGQAVSAREWQRSEMEDRAAAVLEV